MNLNTKSIFKKAEQGGYAIGQFNVSNADQMKAVIEAAKKINSPVIIGTSEGESEFFGMKQAVALAEIYEKKTGLPIILNADHTKSFEKIKKYLDAGYNSVHFDGSSLSFEENLEITKKVVELARSYSSDISVEGELGYIPGASKVHTEKVEIKEEYHTKPEEVLKFIEETGIDRLAVVFGNTHGIDIEQPKLDFERLEKIKKLVGDKAVLVLHGGSGISDGDIKKCVELGIRKININTELRVAFAGGLQKSLTTGETTPYKFLAPAKLAMQEIVENKIKLFGSVI